MAGYRAQVRRACIRLDKRRRPFDYASVLVEIPEGPYKPTPKQLIVELSTAKYLKVVTKGDRHTPTTYRVRKRFREREHGRR